MKSMRSGLCSVILFSTIIVFPTLSIDLISPIHDFYNSNNFYQSTEPNFYGKMSDFYDEITDFYDQNENFYKSHDLYDYNDFYSHYHLPDSYYEHELEFYDQSMDFYRDMLDAYNKEMDAYYQDVSSYDLYSTDSYKFDSYNHDDLHQRSFYTAEKQSRRDIYNKLYELSPYKPNTKQFRGFKKDISKLVSSINKHLLNITKWDKIMDEAKRANLSNRFIEDLKNLSSKDKKEFIRLVNKIIIF